MKLSIIVPVYNIEEYIGGCIESICNLTIKDFELIVVDDGSKDNSLQICREYAEKDHRIKVITKPNSGVSATRNMGLDIAAGEYVMFVDGDDAVDPMMAEILITDMEEQASIEHQANIEHQASTEHQASIEHQASNEEQASSHLVMACCGHQLIREIPNVVETCYQKNASRPAQITDSDVELDRMIAWETSCALWDRIYRRDLIGDIRFVEGALTEDKFFNVQYLLQNKGKVSKREEEFYRYLVRENSSSRVGFSEKFFALLDVAQQTIDVTANESEALQESALFNMYRTKLYILLLITAANQQGKYKSLFKEYMNYLEEHKAILEKRPLPAKVQKQYRLLKIHPNVLSISMRTIKCIIQMLLRIRNTIRGN
ncbi:MAG: glycosyltransferase [Eubacteriales bacterium]